MTQSILIVAISINQLGNQIPFLLELYVFDVDDNGKHLKIEKKYKLTLLSHEFPDPPE